jgi:pimeloyl-ACP methyl ester carboxylesterase
MKLFNDAYKDISKPSSHYRFIETSQGIVAVWDSKPNTVNSIPTIVLIHGHCTNKGFFVKQLISPLFERYRLVAIDLPGYGKSSPPKNPERTYSFPGYASVVAEVIDLMKLDHHLVVVG